MTDLPDVKLKALVTFPATIIGGAGVDADSANGSVNLSISYDDFAPPAASISDAANQTALIWNKVSGSYTLVPLSLFSGAGIPDAPNDGTVYGRRNLAWSRAVAVAGDTMTGTLTIATTAATGRLLFGTSGTKYLDFDGTDWTLNGNGLLKIIGNGVRADGPVTANFTGTTGAFFFGNTGTKFVTWDNTSFTFQGGPFTLLADPAVPLGAATKQYVDAADALKAPLASPALTGNPTAPTAAPGDNDTTIATTAFVTAAVIAGGGVVPAALTRTNDTNVTLTLGGTPATALLQATSVTVGWTGTLGAVRGGFGADVSAANGVPVFAAGVATFVSTPGSGSIIRESANGVIENRIINPSGMISQLATSGSAADGVYGWDQWCILTQSNPVAWSKLTNVEDGTPYMMRLTQSNASAQRFGQIQAIETASCIDMRNQTVVLQARVRCSAATNIRAAILEWGGTADAPVMDVVNDWTNASISPGNFIKASGMLVTATNATAVAANTLTTISVSGTVNNAASTPNNLMLFIWTESTQAQNVTLDVGKVKFALGSVATNYEPRPADEELFLCQKFIDVIAPNLTSAEPFAGGSVSGTFAVFPLRTRRKMFKIPTASVSAIGDWAVNPFGPGSLQTATNFTFAVVHQEGARAQLTTAASGATGGAMAALSAVNANAAIYFVAQM